ncbi:hypothetical protein TEK04_12680 [Klenkia sp. LSe6-5]|uniref:Excreted virulence factor EspC, type VII ESX diderm n=1 Tax=Klenkia sesuvii TaxID=3103137 RepID=A0ABU8DUR8_9ACTN
MPDVVTMQLDAVQALATDLAELAAELAVGSGTTRAEGSRLGLALSGPAADELAATGAGWAGLVEALAGRAGVVATGLQQAVASYRVLDGLLLQRMGPGPGAVTAR